VPRHLSGGAGRTSPSVSESQFRELFFLPKRDFFVTGTYGTRRPYPPGPLPSHKASAVESAPITPCHRNPSFLKSPTNTTSQLTYTANPPPESRPVPSSPVTTPLPPPRRSVALVGSVALLASLDIECGLVLLHPDDHRHGLLARRRRRAPLLLQFPLQLGSGSKGGGRGRILLLLLQLVIGISGGASAISGEGEAGAEGRGRGGRARSSLLR
jgi:hypothetical protein